MIQYFSEKDPNEMRLSTNSDMYILELLQHLFIFQQETTFGICLMVRRLVTFTLSTSSSQSHWQS